MKTSKQLKAPRGKESAPHGLVRAETVAQHFDMSPRAVRHLAQTGVLPCVRIGKLVRFSIADIEAAINSRTSRS